MVAPVRGTDAEGALKDLRKSLGDTISLSLGDTNIICANVYINSDNITTRDILAVESEEDDHNDEASGDEDPIVLA